MVRSARAHGIELPYNVMLPEDIKNDPTMQPVIFRGQNGESTLHHRRGEQHRSEIEMIEGDWDGGAWQVIYRRVPELSAGYRAVIAVPMRLRARPIGGLNLLYTRTLNDTLLCEPRWPLSLAHALADLSVLALVQDRDEHREQRLVEHTLATLNDRIHLSQATGMVAAATGLDPHQARRAIRGHAHQRQQPLPEIVRAITDRELDPTQLAVNTTVADTETYP